MLGSDMPPDSFFEWHTSTPWARPISGPEWVFPVVESSFTDPVDGTDRHWPSVCLRCLTRPTRYGSCLAREFAQEYWESKAG
jgi:hypothetical protein